MPRVNALPPDGSLMPDERKELHLEKSLPLLNTISAWLVQELEQTLSDYRVGVNLCASYSRHNRSRVAGAD